VHIWAANHHRWVSGSTVNVPPIATPVQNRPLMQTQMMIPRIVLPRMTCPAPGISHPSSPARKGVSGFGVWVLAMSCRLRALVSRHFR